MILNKITKQDTFLHLCSTGNHTKTQVCIKKSKQPRAYVLEFLEELKGEGIREVDKLKFAVSEV